MNIALVTETFPPEVNGVAMTFGVIARELGRRGPNVTVYRPRRDDLPPAPVSEDFAEVALPWLPVSGYRALRIGLPAKRMLRQYWNGFGPTSCMSRPKAPWVRRRFRSHGQWAFR